MTGSHEHAERAKNQQHTAALRWAKHYAYPENSVAHNDSTVNEFIRLATQDSDPIAFHYGRNHLVVPAIGAVYLITDAPEGFYLVGMDAVNTAPRAVGPVPTLNDLVRCAWPMRGEAPCNYCTNVGSTAALLPVAHPPQVVAMCLCRTCFTNLDTKYPKLNFVFPTTIPNLTEA
jgi:hypothetical protein